MFSTGRAKVGKFKVDSLNTSPPLFFLYPKWFSVSFQSCLNPSRHHKYIRLDQPISGNGANKKYVDAPTTSGDESPITRPRKLQASLELMSKSEPHLTKDDKVVSIPREADTVNLLKIRRGRAEAPATTPENDFVPTRPRKIRVPTDLKRHKPLPRPHSTKDHRDLGKTASRLHGEFTSTSRPLKDQAAIDLRVQPESLSLPYVIKNHTVSNTVKEIRSAGYDKKYQKNAELLAVNSQNNYVATSPSRCQVMNDLRRRNPPPHHVENKKSLDDVKVYQDQHDISQERIPRIFNRKPIDWIPLAGMMANIPLGSILPDETRVYLPVDILLELTGSTGSNMWIHNVGTGCKVHVRPDTECKTASRLIVLQGSQRAQEVTKEYLLRRKEGFGKAVQTDQPYLEETRSNVSLQGIQSVRTFSAYVSQLLRPTPRLVWKSISPDQTQNQGIAAAFASLFSNPDTSPFASIVALNKVLKFLSRHSELTATLTFIYNKAQELGLKLNTESYNTLIESALKNHTTEHVKNLISDMQQSRTSANGRTWIILFSSIDSMIGRRELLIRMKELGVKLDITTIGSIARVLVDEAFPKVSGIESEWTEFVKQMDSAFGSIWLFSTTFNRMIHLCATTKRFTLATKVIELASQRGLRLDNSNLIHLLGLCRRKGNLRQSISLLKATHSQNVTLEGLTISSIFMTAWKKRFYNLCKVLWRYAASNGLITRRMQDVVQKSLKQNTTRSDSKSETWRRLAGKIVVDVDSHKIDRLEFPLLSKQYPEADALTWLLKYTTDDGTRTEQLSLAYRIVQQDLDVWEYCEPLTKDQLFVLLDKAYEKDCDWMTQNLNFTTPGEKLNDLSIRIDLKILSESRQVFQRQKRNIGLNIVSLKRITSEEPEMKFRVIGNKSQSNTSWSSVDLPLSQRKAFIQHLSDMFQRNEYMQTIIPGYHS